MEPEQFPKHIVSRTDEKVIEKKDGVWNVRNRKLTAEGPGFPSRGLPHVAFWILTWENERGLNALSLLSPSAICHTTRTWGDFREVRVVFWGSFTAPTGKDLAGESSEAAQESVEWSRFLQRSLGVSTLGSSCTEVGWSKYKSFYRNYLKRFKLLSSPFAHSQSSFHCVGADTSSEKRMRERGGLVSVPNDSSLCCPVFTAPCGCSSWSSSQSLISHIDGNARHAYPILKMKWSKSNHV